MKTFNEKIYEKLRSVPFGHVTTYKELAHSVGTKAYRAVGKAMKNNKEPDKIPCFKVVKSDGGLGNYSLGIKEKIRRLDKEGIKTKKGKILNFKDVLCRIR